MLSCFNIYYNSPFDIILGGLFDYIFFFYKSSFSNKILTSATPTFILANLITLFYFCYIQIVLFNFFFLPWPLMCSWSIMLKWLIGGKITLSIAFFNLGSLKCNVAIMISLWMVVVIMAIRHNYFNILHCRVSNSL